MSSMILIYAPKIHKLFILGEITSFDRPGSSGEGAPSTPGLGAEKHIVTHRVNVAPLGTLKAWPEGKLKKSSGDRDSSESDFTTEVKPPVHSRGHVYHDAHVIPKPGDSHVVSKITSNYCSEIEC